MIGCFSLARETFDIDFAKKKLIKTKKSLKKLNKKIIFFDDLVTNDKIGQNAIKYFKNISTFTTIDIPNQPNSIKGSELQNILSKSKNVTYKKSINEAIKSIPLKKDDLVLITGSLYLAGEVLNSN